MADRDRELQIRRRLVEALHADLIGPFVRPDQPACAEELLFDDPRADVAALSDTSGFDHESRWSTLRMADVDGDRRMDVCARTVMGLDCWRSPQPTPGLSPPTRT